MPTREEEEKKKKALENAILGLDPNYELSWKPPDIQPSTSTFDVGGVSPSTVTAQDFGGLEKAYDVPPIPDSEKIQPFPSPSFALEPAKKEIQPAPAPVARPLPKPKPAPAPVMGPREPTPEEAYESKTMDIASRKEDIRKRLAEKRSEDMSTQELIGAALAGLGGAMSGRDTLTPTLGGIEKRHAQDIEAIQLEEAALDKEAEDLYRKEQNRLKMNLEERMMDLKRKQVEAEVLRKAEGREQTEAQKAADRTFGKEYAEYVSGGGFADTMTQIAGLESVLEKLEGRVKAGNLTGGGLSMLPDWARKRIFSESMAAQQLVEKSVQRTLKKTLGGQFTEKEGILFMQRGYDPALPEEQNAKKLRDTIGQLKIMALAKQKAIDHYEEYGTLDNFKGEFWTLQDGMMVPAKKEDFEQMMTKAPPTKAEAQYVFDDPEEEKEYQVWKRQQAGG